MSSIKYTDDNGLLYLIQKIKTLLGNKVDKETGKGLSTNDYTNADKTIVTGIDGRVTTLENAGYQTANDVDTAINAKMGSTYKAKGSIAFANLPELTSSNEGNVYNITDAFTTTSNFVEGAGKEHPAGTNVVIINTSGSTYKYDVLSGIVDLSGYVQTNDLVAITNAEIDTMWNGN